MALPRMAHHPGLKIDALTAVIMVPEAGDEAHTLDLAEFRRPRGHGVPYPSLRNVGIGRVALRVTEFDAALDRLRRLKMLATSTG